MHYSLTAGVSILSIFLFVNLSLALSDHNSEYIEDSYIVMVQEGTPVNEVITAAARLTGGVVGHSYGTALNGFSIKLPPGMSKKLLKDIEGVLEVEYDLWMSLDVVTPYGEASAQVVSGINAASAQVIPNGVMRIGAVQNSQTKIDGIADPFPLRIAVLDSGVNLTHPDLNVVAGINFTGLGSANDINGHGTHVAGIIAAIDNGIGVVGVAPGAPIYAVKVLGNTGTGALADILKGIDWVTENANLISIANMSLGGAGQSVAYRQALQNAESAGVLFVVAAGNSTADIYGSDANYNSGDDFLPASYPEVMTISALTDRDGRSGALAGTDDDTLAYYSNYNDQPGIEVIVNSSGGGIDLAAPGTDIYSTWAGGSYNHLSGTSMASPHVAGAAALYMRKFGRDVNADGFINKLDMRLIRQGLIDMGDYQFSWGATNSLDPDLNPEQLLNVGGF